MNIEKQFNEFHAENPRVYVLFKKFCSEVLSAGRQRYSSKAIFEQIRWHIYVVTRSDDDFKLNNNYTAHYARLWIHEHPHHRTFFETRTSHWDNEQADMLA